MITSSEKQHQRRETMLAKGRSYFVWRYGVIGFGVTTGLCWAVAMELWRSGFGQFSIAQLAIHLVGALLLFPAGGYLWGRCMWSLWKRAGTRE